MFNDLTPKCSDKSIYRKLLFEIFSRYVGNTEDGKYTRIQKTQPKCPRGEVVGISQKLRFLKCFKKKNHKLRFVWLVRMEKHYWKRENKIETWKSVSIEANRKKFNKIEPQLFCWKLFYWNFFFQFSSQSNLKLKIKVRFFKVLPLFIFRSLELFSIMFFFFIFINSIVNALLSQKTTKNEFFFAVLVNSEKVYMNHWMYGCMDWVGGILS